MIKTKSRKTQGIKIIFENCFAISSIDILLVVDKNGQCLKTSILTVLLIFIILVTLHAWETLCNM